MSDAYQFAYLSYDDLMGALKAKYGDDADDWRIVSVTSTTDDVAAERVKVYVRPVEMRTVVSGAVNAIRIEWNGEGDDE